MRIAKNNSILELFAIRISHFAFFMFWPVPCGWWPKQLVAQEQVAFGLCIFAYFHSSTCPLDWWWPELLVERFAICTLHLAVLHSFCMFRAALGGWLGEQLVTRERPHSSGREGEGEEGSSRKSKRFKGTGGPEVLCGGANSHSTVPPLCRRSLEDAAQIWVRRGDG